MLFFADGKRSSGLVRRPLPVVVSPFTENDDGGKTYEPYGNFAPPADDFGRIAAQFINCISTLLRCAQANAAGDAMSSFNAKAKGLESYKAEVYKAIQVASNLDKDLLNELIQEAKGQLAEAERQLKLAQADLEAEKSQSAEVRKQIGRLFQWTELYSEATFDAQKMILAQLIDRVTVWKGYRIEIECNVGCRQFFESLEADAQKSA